MSKVIFLLLLLSIFSYSQAASAQHTMDDSSNNKTKLAIPKSLLYNEVEIILKDGSVFRGLLSEVKDDTLVCLYRNGKKAISYNGMQRLKIFDVEKNVNTYAIIGAFSGIYLGHLLFVRASDHPTAYTTKEYPEGVELLLVNSAFATAGMSLGYLIGSSLPAQLNFDFSESAEEAHAEWIKFHSIIKEEKLKKRYNFNIYAGNVSPAILDEYKVIMRKNGYEIFGSECGYYGNGFDDASNFNLLRRLQITYQLYPNCEVGVAIIWQGEPSFCAHGYTQTTTSDEERNLNFRYNAVGFYTAFNYEPLPRLAKSDIKWNVGLSLGFVSASLDIKGRVYRYENYEPFEYFETEVDHHWEKSIISTALLTELRFHLYNTFSVGIYADYTMSPAQDLLALPEFGITPQRQSIGNYSVGFSIGLHF